MRHLPGVAVGVADGPQMGYFERMSDSQTAYFERMNPNISQSCIRYLDLCEH